MKTNLLVLAALLPALSGCVTIGDEAKGLAPAQHGDGPAVKWDLSARPLPEIPFPNDAATFPDPDSPTGKRVNASMIGPTQMETKVRKKLDQLDGFGISAPITVAFDRELELGSIRAAMQADEHFDDDVVYVVNLNKKSPRYGKPTILDMGNGNFPVTLEKTSFFEEDDRAGESNLIYETVDERDGDGIRSGTDSNHNGVIDVPNVLNPGDDPERDIMTFYERATNTLIMRPLLPLDEQSEYAVILTKRIRGLNDAPVESPFEWVNDLRQTSALKPLVTDGILEDLGLDLDDIAFAWTFTTQSTTAELVAIRQGMEGYGPFSTIKVRYPAQLSSIEPLKTVPSGKGPIHVMDGDIMRSFIRDNYFTVFGGNEDDPDDVARRDALLLNYQFVDYFIAGSYDTPFFVTDSGSFEMNTKTGDYKADHDKVTFTMVVPRATRNHKAPFPVQVHIHGYTSSRLEILFWAGSYTRYGSAVVAIDAVGHGGGILDDDQIAFVKALLGSYGAAEASTIFEEGRAKDLNGDGRPDSGGDYWTADLFHTRDMVRQTVVDIFQLVRIFRGFDGVTRWQFDLNGDGERELAGDFNCDGVVDAGGPFNTYRMSGGSLGGIVTGVAAAVEPYISETVSVAGAASLADVGIRSTQGGVNEAVVLRMLGPLVIAQEGVLGWKVPDVNDAVFIPFTAIPSNVQPGDRMEVHNIANGKTAWTILDADLTGRAGINSDTGDRIEITFREGGEPDAPVRAKITRNDREVEYQAKTWSDTAHVVAPTEGWGMIRQTPEVRRFMAIGAIVTEPGDAVSYARHYFLEPLPILKEGPRAHNILLIPTIGDTAVPVATGIHNARVAGLLPVTEQDARNPDFRYGRGVPWDPAMGFQTWFDKRLSWDEWRVAQGVDWSPERIDLAPTPNAVFVKNYVTEGLERLRRFEHDSRFNDDRETLFDVDVLADGADIDRSHPSLTEPLRISRRTSVGISAVRIPWLEHKGRHGFGLYEPQLPFDMPTYMHSMIGHYVATKGQELIEAPCLEDASCEFIPPPIFDTTKGNQLVPNLGN